jgi:hypothetical protein
MDKKLNGFNNGRDTTDGVGGKSGHFEMMDNQKLTAEEILYKYLKALVTENPKDYVSFDKIKLQKEWAVTLQAMEEYATQFKQSHLPSDEDIEKEAKMRATNNTGYFFGIHYKWFRKGAKWVINKKKHTSQ